MRLLFLLLISYPFFISAQVHFQFVWDKEIVENDKQYFINQNDWVSFSELKLYLSNYSLLSERKTLTLNAVDLIDNSITNSKIILDSIDPARYKMLRFNFGLDSTINTSGDLAGDLDPILGMYWAWNSGYIHLKMTGSSTLIPSTKKEFEFHLGGYRRPNQTYFLVELPIFGNTLQFDLKPLFSRYIDFQNQSMIMIPGQTARKICESASKLFSTK